MNPVKALANLSSLKLSQKLLILFSIIAVSLSVAFWNKINIAQHTLLVALLLLPGIGIIGGYARVRNRLAIYRLVLGTQLTFPIFVLCDYFFGTSEQTFSISLGIAVILGGIQAIALYFFSQFLSIYQISKAQTDRKNLFETELLLNLLGLFYSVSILWISVYFNPTRIAELSFSWIYLLGFFEITILFGFCVSVLGIFQERLKYFFVGALITLLCGTPLIWTPSWAFFTRYDMFCRESCWFPLDIHFGLQILILFVLEIILGVLFWNRLRPESEINIKELATKPSLLIIIATLFLNGVSYYSYREKPISLSSDFLEVSIGSSSIRLGQIFEPFMQKEGIPKSYGTLIATTTVGQRVHMGDIDFYLEADKLKSFVIKIDKDSTLTLVGGKPFSAYLGNAIQLVKMLGEPVRDMKESYYLHQKDKTPYRKMVFNKGATSLGSTLVTLYFAQETESCREDLPRDIVCLWGLETSVEPFPKPLFNSKVKELIDFSPFDLIETTRLAENGDAQAQFRLGSYYSVDIYDHPQDINFGKAMRWHLKAAEQDIALSQGAIGSMYELGWGVPNDFVAAYKWFFIAKKSLEKTGAPTELATNPIQYLLQSGKLTPFQVKEAERLAMEWRFHRFGEQIISENDPTISVIPGITR